MIIGIINAEPIKCLFGIGMFDNTIIEINGNIIDGIIVK